MADIGRQAAEEMPAHVAKRPTPGRTTARANVEGCHLLSGFAGPMRRVQPMTQGEEFKERRGEPSFASLWKVLGGWILLDF